MKSLKIVLLSALLVAPQAFAGTKSTEGLSRQVSALKNALQNWRGIVDAELSSLRTNIDDLVADADRAHTCAASQMLYDGSSCVPLPVQTASASSTPSRSSPPQPSRLSSATRCLAARPPTRSTEWKLKFQTGFTMGLFMKLQHPAS